MKCKEKTAGGIVLDKKTLGERIRQQKTLIAFLIPGIVLVLLFNYVPMVGLVMALLN